MQAKDLQARTNTVNTCDKSTDFVIPRYDVKFREAFRTIQELIQAVTGRDLSIQAADGRCPPGFLQRVPYILQEFGGE